ncbi:MAG: hypothetical protein EAX81_07420 [Candidatus Thorarchaeota archaeon]|nr:hypothetical protein [Candidatus Thorarchaeota archaeon]
MLTSVGKRAIPSTFIAIMILLLSCSLPAQAVDVVHVRGPYVDKVVYKMSVADTPGDQEILMLLNNEIDFTGIDPSLVEELCGIEHIEVVGQPRCGYGYLSMNCAKYPFNITSFRRAIAFAIDKRKIASYLWQGFGEPLDSCIPSMNPFSIEGQQPYTYYDPRPDIAVALLETSGFDIDIETGFRTAPNGQPFSVKIECGMGDQAVCAAEHVAEVLRDLSIDAYAQPTDFVSLQGRLIYHQDYDISFQGIRVPEYNVAWLGFYFWSEYADRPYYNSANFQNESFDSLREQLLLSLDHDEVLDAAMKMQEILLYECPWIILYENLDFYAFRTDRFEGAETYNSWWRSYSVHLKEEEGGPLGGTYRYFGHSLTTLNFMATSFTFDHAIIQLLYDTLLRTDSDGSIIPWLAKSYLIESYIDNPSILPGRTRMTFNLVDNVTWSDGTSLTAMDVAYTFNYYYQSSGNPEGAYLTDMLAAYAIGPYTFVIEFGEESFWNLDRVAFAYILPKHILETIGLEDWNTWQPNPPSEPMVTSGPFNVSEWIRGEILELSANPNYFHQPERDILATTTSITTTASTTQLDGEYDMMLAFVAGTTSAAAVILVGVVIVRRQYP